MIIHHKQNDHLITLSYAEWLKDYIRTDKYVNYVVHDPSGVVELHKVDENTGEFKFNMLVDDYLGKQFVSREPIRFKTEPLSGSFSDEYLKAVSPNKKGHFLNFFRIPSKIKTQATPKMKDGKSKSTRWISSISNNRLFVGIILLILGSILGFAKMRAIINDWIERVF